MAGMTSHANTLLHIVNKPADKLLHAYWILYYYFQLINGDTAKVHMQGDTSGFISAL